MEWVAGVLSATALSVTLILPGIIPTYLTAILLFCAWSAVILERQQIDTHTLESELGWKLRQNCGKGIFCVLLIPCAVLLTTFHHHPHMQDDFCKMLVMMSVGAILAPLLIISYTILVTKPKTANNVVEGQDKAGEAKTDSTGSNEKRGINSDQEDNTDKTDTKDGDTEEKLKKSGDKDIEKKTDSDKSKVQKQYKSTKHKKERAGENSNIETSTLSINSKTSKLESITKTENSSTKSKSNRNSNKKVQSTEGNQTRTEENAPSENKTQSTASESNASSITASKSTASSITASTSATWKSTASTNTASGNTSQIQLEWNLNTILSVTYLVCIVALMLFMMMLSIRSVGAMATTFLGMHTLLLSILLTTLPVLTPRSFSLGEATVASQALTYFQLLLSSQLWYRFEWLKISSTLLTSVSDVTAFTEVVLLSCVLVVVVLLFWPSWRSSPHVYLLLPAIVVCFSTPSLYVILGTDFVSWLIGYINSDAIKFYLFVYWAACTCVSVLIVYFNTSGGRQAQQAAKPSFHLPAKIRNRIRATQSQQKEEVMDAAATDETTKAALGVTGTTGGGGSKGVSSAVRKKFHILAVCAFVPGLVFDPPLTMCAWSCALVVFIILECVRIVEVYPLSSLLEGYLKVFLDSQDEGSVILTPIYLLCGCTVPLWLYQGSASHIVLFSGILSLGIGDTAASVIGSKYGRHKIPGSLKSIEGTIANIISQFIFLQVFTLTGFCPTFSWVQLAPAIIVTSLVEATTSQIDNLVLPLLMYCLVVS